MPLPLAQGKRRIALMVAPESIAGSAPPPLLRDVIPRLPQIAARRLVATGGTHRLNRAYGARVWFHGMGSIDRMRLSHAAFGHRSAVAAIDTETTGHGNRDACSMGGRERRPRGWRNPVRAMTTQCHGGNGCARSAGVTMIIPRGCWSKQRPGRDWSRRAVSSPACQRARPNSARQSSNSKDGRAIDGHRRSGHQPLPDAAILRRHTGSRISPFAACTPSSSCIPSRGWSVCATTAPTPT